MQYGNGLTKFVSNRISRITAISYFTQNVKQVITMPGDASIISTFHDINLCILLFSYAFQKTTFPINLSPD